MLEMIRHQLKRHKYKIVVGVPMAFLLASTLSLIRDPAQVYLVPNDGKYVAVGEHVRLRLLATADEPINVVGGTIHIPTDRLVVNSISRENSVIDLWSEEPSLSDDGTIRFSGGIISDSGFVGSGIILTLEVSATTTGEAAIGLDDVHMLAHDGTGKEVSSSNNPMTLIVRDSDYPSPDVNGDSRVDFFDFGIVSTRLFRVYESTYDLNLDGKITIADLGVLISQMTRK